MVLIASGLGMVDHAHRRRHYDHLVFWLAGIGALHLGLIADAHPAGASGGGCRWHASIAAACLLLFGIRRLRAFRISSDRQPIVQAAHRAAFSTAAR
jgi:hypothetical protein